MRAPNNRSYVARAASRSSTATPRWWIPRGCTRAMLSVELSTPRRAAAQRREACRRSLTRATRERDLQHVDQLFLRLQVPILVRQVERVTERGAAGDDRDLLQVAELAHQVRHERMARFVVRKDSPLLVRQDLLLLQAGDHT